MNQYRFQGRNHNITSYAHSLFFLHVGHVGVGPPPPSTLLQDAEDQFDTQWLQHLGLRQVFQSGEVADGATLSQV